MKSVLGCAAVAAACGAARELAPRLTPSAQAHSAALVSPSVQRVLATTPKIKCPAEMAEVSRGGRSFCIDRWEASLERLAPSGARTPWPGNHVVDGFEHELVAVSVAGVKPQGYISGLQAAEACANAGKRLCEIDEWVHACRGAQAKTYPYGNERRAGVCNDRFKLFGEHPVLALFEREAPRGANRAEMWGPAWMNDPRIHEQPHSVDATGAHPECVSDAGVYDLVGNLHEWTADPEGTFVGGFFMDTLQNGEGCGYRTRAHDFKYHDYSTGFRCCKDAE